ncbi:MAG: hypothetical protein M1504_04215, partial [Candidatus Marsarchaeota archaeon]|nr:hypothetical protein [Candidatus Marsarchaeota archaeon]
AGIIGFVVMWLNYFTITVGVSPTIFNGYISWIGGAAAMLGYTLGSHSHVMGMAIILGVVAIVASKFGVLEMGGLKSRVAKFGMLVSIAGLIVMVVVYLLEGFTPIWPNSTPPLLFASNPSGFQLWSATDANGMAGDDSTMFLASIGAMIILIPLLLTKAKGKSVWKDPLRLSVMATWILAFIATPIEGFFIEFNEATMQGGPTDIVFGNIQYFALFGITMIAMAFLAVDFFQDKARVRKAIAITGISVIVFTLISGFVYAYMDPGVPNSNGTLSMTNSGWLYSIGLLLMSFVILGALAALYVAPDIKISPPPEAKKPFRLHFPLRHKHLISG